MVTQDKSCKSLVKTKQKCKHIRNGNSCCHQRKKCESLLPECDTKNFLNLSMEMVVGIFWNYNLKSQVTICLHSSEELSPRC